MNKKSVSVIIPAYNEAEVIGVVLADIQKYLAGYEHEIIVVDDGSTDGTGGIANKAGAVIVRNSSNMGYGFSLKRGVHTARFEYVLTIDADGTYPADKIPELMQKAGEGFDMAIGARRGQTYWSSITKSIFRIFFKYIAEFVAGTSIPDINSGFRVINREKLLPVLPDLSKGFSFSTSVTLIFFLKGYFVAYIPIPYARRHGKTKVKHFRDSLRALQIMVDVAVSYNPIKFFMLVAGFPFILFLTTFILGWILWQSWLLVVSAVFLASVFLIMSIGFFSTIFRVK